VGALVLPFGGVAPVLGHDVFLAPTAVPVGRVALGEVASVGHAAPQRGDVHAIEVGAQSIVQDGALVGIGARVEFEAGARREPPPER